VHECHKHCHTGCDLSHKQACLQDICHVAADGDCARQDCCLDNTVTVGTCKGLLQDAVVHPETGSPKPGTVTTGSQQQIIRRRASDFHCFRMGSLPEGLQGVVRTMPTDSHIQKWLPEVGKCHRLPGGDWDTLQVQCSMSEHTGRPAALLAQQLHLQQVGCNVCS
jgi:hypothetical protein